VSEAALVGGLVFCSLRWRWDHELKLFLWIETLSEFALILVPFDPCWSLLIFEQWSLLLSGRIASQLAHRV
jgi:hypothetical protein